MNEEQEQVYRLLDFLDGSKGMGLALGTIATQPGFYCSMEANFMDANSVMRSLFDFCYPVGSYYHTSDASFDPNDSWGGTWSLLGEGQVLLSGSANGSYQVGTQYGGNTKSYTPAGTIGDTKLSDAQIAHGHGFTQPKIPAHTHNMGSGRSFVTHSSAESATIGETSCSLPGSGYYVPTIKSDDNWYGAVNTASSGGGGACTNGAVSDLSGASSTRTAHGHTWTGTARDVNVMQLSTAVYIWHRTA